MTGVLGSVTSLQSSLGVLSLVEDVSAGDTRVGAAGGVVSGGIGGVFTNT